MIRRLLFSASAWSFVVPVAACIVLAAVWERPLDWMLLPFVAAALIAAVFVAVHHAEVVALRVGEPFGTLILALAVTVIELSLIVSLMLSGGATASSLARDTVFATVMIVCNGVVGLCLLMGALRHRVLAFRVEGTYPALSVLATLTVLTLVLPTFTSTTPGPTLSPAQLAFVGVVSLTLYGVFVFVQTVRHRGYFLPVGAESEDLQPTPPSRSVALASLALLILCLVAVVGLAKMLAPSIEAAVAAASAPRAVVGIVIALMVLLPETLAAMRTALRDRMQTSFNLALGSALATIGLTIPAVAATSIALELRLDLGLPPKRDDSASANPDDFGDDTVWGSFHSPSGGRAPGLVRCISLPCSRAVSRPNKTFQPMVLALRTRPAAERRRWVSLEIAFLGLSKQYSMTLVPRGYCIYNNRDHLLRSCQA